jgi:hypothetical protein
MHKMQKLQSAFEYITTYSWAILILAIVLGLLYVLNLFTPQPYSQTQCVLGQDLACQNTYINTTGALYLQVLSSGNDPINITAIGCTQNSTTTHMKKFTTASQIYLPIGSSYTFGIQCYASTGGKISLNTGDVFSGGVIINYTDEVTGFNQTVVGKIVTRAQPVIVALT